MHCWGNLSRWVISWSDWISESLDRAIFWILIYLLSVRMPSVLMSGITHGSLWPGADDTWRISGPCHAVTSESCHSAGLWSRRGRSVLEEAPGITRHSSLLQISRPVHPEPGPDIQTVPALWGQRREREGGSPGWSWDQAGAGLVTSHTWVWEQRSRVLIRKC